MDRLLRRTRLAYTLPRSLRKCWPLWTKACEISIFCKKHQTPRYEAQMILATKPVRRVVRTGKFGRCFSWKVAEEDPGMSLLSKKDMKDISGPVRHQRPHENCWGHVATDVFSGSPMVTGEDAQFRSFSTRYLTFYAYPSSRAELRDKRGADCEHLCHPHPLPEAFTFMKRTGVPERSPTEDQEYSCVLDPPEEHPTLGMYKIGEDVKIRFSNKLSDLYEMLLVQPVAAVLHYFYPEADEIGSNIYYGPTNENSEYWGTHAVIITAIRKIKGELVAFVKSSHGEERGDGGYIKVSLTQMVLGTGDDNELTSPSLLLRNFCCPVVQKPSVAEEAEPSESKPEPPKSGEKEKKRKNQTQGFGRESKKSKLAETGASDQPSFSGVPFHNCDQSGLHSAYTGSLPYVKDEKSSDEENVEPVPAGAAASNVVKADQKQKAKVADLKPGSDDSDASSDEEKESSDDEYDSERGMAVDGEYSDDSEEDCGEEEETPKQPEPSHKKRASESASKAPASKKAKTAAAVTPHKTEEKKKEGHTAKEGGKSPANAKQSPKAGGQSSGGGGNKKPSNSKKKNSGSNSKGKGKGRA